MSVQLEARFESDSKANLAVDRLRQSGIIFELLELKPTASRWKTDGEIKNQAINSVFPKTEGLVSMYPSGLPFDHICARAYMASNSIREPQQKNDTDTQLRISVTEKSLGKAEKIIRNSKGYGLKLGK
jgi:hypothetical protein